MTSFVLLFVFGFNFVMGDKTLGSTIQKPGNLVDTQGFTFKNAYDISALLDNKGPTGTVNLYSGGRVGPGKPYYVINEPLIVPHQAISSSGSTFSVGSSNTLLGVAFFAGAFIAVIFSYLCLWVGGTKRLEDLNDSKDEKNADKLINRRRRSTDADTEELSSNVLSAIENGECLQKTICLLGNQLGLAIGAGSTKTLLVSSVLDKIISKENKKNIYYFNLQNVLRGKSQCDKVDCLTETNK